MVIHQRAWLATASLNELPSGLHILSCLVDCSVRCVPENPDLLENVMILLLRVMESGHEELGLSAIFELLDMFRDMKIDVNPLLTLPGVKAVKFFDKSGFLAGLSG